MCRTHKMTTWIESFQQGKKTYFANVGEEGKDLDLVCLVIFDYLTVFKWHTRLQTPPTKK